MVLFNFEEHLKDKHCRVHKNNILSLFKSVQFKWYFRTTSLNCPETCHHQPFLPCFYCEKISLSQRNFQSKCLKSEITEPSNVVAQEEKISFYDWVTILLWMSDPKNSDTSPSKWDFFASGLWPSWHVSGITYFDCKSRRNHLHDLCFQASFLSNGISASMIIVFSESIPRINMRLKSMTSVLWFLWQHDQEEVTLNRFHFVTKQGSYNMSFYCVIVSNNSKIFLVYGETYNIQEYLKALLKRVLEYVVAGMPSLQIYTV